MPSLNISQTKCFVSGISFPSGKQQAQLLTDVYQEANVNPNQVAYVEAHGTGTKVGDPQEANAIAEVFCSNRSDTLPIGSVKSNMGHAEPASAMASLAKAGSSIPHFFVKLYGSFCHLGDNRHGVRIPPSQSAFQ